jgi:hypothetical protein
MVGGGSMMAGAGAPTGGSVPSKDPKTSGLSVDVKGSSQTYEIKLD